MTWPNYAVSRRIVRNRVVQRIRIETAVTPHDRQMRRPLQFTIGSKAYSISVLWTVPNMDSQRTRGFKVNQWILDLTVVSSFIVASVAGRARSFLKGCRHARVPQPSPSVDTICSSPFWERCLIVLQLVQNCYALIASWLAYDKSDGLKGATQPVLYRVDAASLRPRCSALSPYSELP